MSRRKGAFNLWAGVAAIATAMFLALSIGLAASSASAEAPVGNSIWTLPGDAPFVTDTPTPTPTPTNTPQSDCCTGINGTGSGFCLPTYPYYYNFTVNNPCPTAVTGNFYVYLDVAAESSG